MSSPTDGQCTGEHEGREKVEIVIDGVEVSASAKVENERRLLALVGKTIADAYLVLVKGKRDRESFKDRPDEAIRLHPGMRFVTVPLGPTPVS
jgi:hypothetical protein